MGWTGWETEPAGSLGSVCRNGSLGSLRYLCWFLVISESELHSVCLFKFLTL